MTRLRDIELPALDRFVSEHAFEEAAVAADRRVVAVAGCTRTGGGQRPDGKEVPG